MATTFKDTLLAYGALVAAVAAVITGVADYQVASNPQARPDPFTGTDAAVLKQDLQRQCDYKIAEVHKHITEWEQWRKEHREFADKRVILTERWRGQIETEIEQLKWNRGYNGQ